MKHTDRFCRDFAKIHLEKKLLVFFFDEKVTESKFPDTRVIYGSAGLGKHTVYVSVMRWQDFVN